MSKRYKFLFFDLDHTIWDFEANAKTALKIAFEGNKLESEGVSSFDAFFEKYSYHNHILWSRYTQGLIKQEELRWKRMWRTLIEFKVGDEKIARKMSEDFLQELPLQKQLFPYTIEILTYLKNKDYQLNLITNGFDEVQNKKLLHAGLSPYFNKMITSQASNSLKPHKEIFAYAIKETQAEKYSSIMIGDNLEADIEGALNFGIDAIWVNHTNIPTSKQPTYIVTHLKQLENIF